MTKPIDTTNYEFYFWLGMDGELESVSKEDFERKQDQIRKEHEDWLNVETNG